MNNVIYGLIDPNTKELRYIGKTDNLEKRLINHHKKSQLKKKSHKNSWLKFLIKKNQRAEAVILESYQTYEELDVAEINAIAFYKSAGYHLTNGTDGGDGFKGQHSEETKKKMSLSHSGVNSFWLGKHHSDETKEKLSNFHKNSPKIIRKLTEENVRLIRVMLENKISTRKIAKQFNVSSSTISSIAWGWTYTWVK